MINAGYYNHKIIIFQKVQTEDEQGFPIWEDRIVLATWARVKTLRGYTILMNGDADFEKAYVNFTIRFPKHVKITRDMNIAFRDKIYRIDYVNNIDEADVELEIQAIEVTK